MTVFPSSFNNEEVCTCPQASVPEQFTSVPWNSYNRDMLKALYRFAPISMHCNKTSGVSFQVRQCDREWWVTAGTQRLLIPYPVPSKPHWCLNLQSQVCPDPEEDPRRVEEGHPEPQTRSTHMRWGK